MITLTILGIISTLILFILMNVMLGVWMIELIVDSFKMMFNR